MGHHPIPRGHADANGMPELATKYDTPSWFPNEVEGSDILYQKTHDDLKKEGIPFNKPFEGGADELINKVKSGYSDIDDLGYLMIPSTGEIIAKDITLSEAVDKQVEWLKQQRNKNNGDVDSSLCR